MATSSTCNYVIVRLKAKRSYNSEHAGVCPPRAFLSQTELGWVTLAMFWWQVAHQAQEIPDQWWAIDHSSHTFSHSKFGGQHTWMQARVYFLWFWTRKKTLFMKLKQIFVLSSGNTAELVWIKVVKYDEVAPGKLEVLHRTPDSDYAQIIRTNDKF